jgi:fructose-1-phosphate kinase PfkB-like protein
LEARPDVIKPNLSELFQLFKAFHPFSPYEKMTEKEFSTSKKDVEFAAELFHSYGTEILCTKGAEGSFFQGECGLVQISSHPIQANSFAGAGDVFLAAFHRFSPVRTDNRQVIQAAMEFATEAALQRISLSKGAFPDFVDLRKKIEAIEIEKNKK